jgi:hypothetical protein
MCSQHFTLKHSQHALLLQSSGRVSHQDNITGTQFFSVLSTHIINEILNMLLKVHLSI